MVPINGEWTPFADVTDQLDHYRLWGLIPPKSKQLRPVMVVDGYFGSPEPCNVVGYQGHNWAVIELPDGYHAIHGEYLAELQPVANQKLPYGMCFVDILSKYIVLDIETTGFDIRNDRIIELAAICYEYGKKVSEFHSMINPGMIIPPDVVSLTGISQNDVDDAPALEDIEGDFLQFIGELPIIGHNALTFDIPFLSAQLSSVLENPVIDTLPMARKVFDLLPRHKLEYLNDVLHLDSAGSHRAINDVETTNALLWACLSPRKYERCVHTAFLNHRLNHHSEYKQRKHSPQRDTAKTQKRDAYLQKKFQKIDIKSITPTCECPAQNSPLCGKAILFTGELSIPRGDAMQMAVDAGAVLKTSVSRKLSYLVVGKQDLSLVGIEGMSTKELKARELNQSGKGQISIISETEFLALVKKEGSVL